MKIFRRIVGMFYKKKSAFVPMGDGTGELVETHLTPEGARASAQLRQLPDLGRLEKGILYSCAVIGARSSPIQIPFFTTFMGQNRPVGLFDGDPLVTTLVETNIDHPMGLTPGNAFCVERLGILFAPSADAEDIKLMCDHFRVELHIESRVVFTSPLAFMFAVRDLPRDGEALEQMRVSRTCLQAELVPLPVILYPGVKFRVALIADGEPWPSPLKRQRLVPVKLWAVLEGQHGSIVV